MSDEGFAIFAIAWLLLIGLLIPTVFNHESREHDRCVEARRIELVVGKPARKCPPLGWWNEPNGHTPEDHGV